MEILMAKMRLHEEGDEKGRLIETEVIQLFGFFYIFLKIRDSSLHLFSPNIKSNHKGGRCGKEEQKNFKEVFHRVFHLNFN